MTTRNSIQTVSSTGRLNKTNQGFTLIEAMIALVVLLFGMLGVIGMQYYSITGNTSSREMRVAINLSQETLEQLKSVPYENVASGSNTPFEDKILSLNAGQLSFERRWWVIADCMDINTEVIPIDEDPCDAGVASVCNGLGDPDDNVVTAFSAIRSRTCWQDRRQNYHFVQIDALRWDEEVIDAVEENP